MITDYATWNSLSPTDREQAEPYNLSRLIIASLNGRTPPLARVLAGNERQAYGLPRIDKKREVNV